MPTYTPRLQLPRPTLDEPADGPDGFNDLSDALDPLVAVYDAGLSSSRPPAGVEGRFWWNTDTSTLDYDDGVAWHSTGGTPVASGTAPVLDVGVQGQIRAGRQLSVADFTSLGLAPPIGLWNLSDLSNLGSDARALANKGAVPFGVGVNGLASNAAVFAGSASQALYIPDSGAADPLRIRIGSWGCWFRTAKRGTAQFLVAKFRTATANRAYALSIDASNIARGDVSLDGAGASVAAMGISDVCDDRWHFAVAVHDGALLRLYVDGVLESVITYAALLFASPAPLNIGGYDADAATAAGLPSYGRVDEAFVIADVLSEDQIRALYCAKLAHPLGVAPTDVRLSVVRRKRGGSLAVADFPTQPIRLHNFTDGSLADEGSGNVALINNGGAINVAGADGAPGGGFSFAGAQSLSATDAGLPAALATRSAGCWFKTTLVSGGTVLAWGNAAAGYIYVNTSGAIGSGSGADLMTGAFVADGQWHFVTLVEDNATGDGVRRKLYLDGRLSVGSTVLNSLTLAGANRFRIGAYSDGTAPFTGQLDGAFVSGVALTAADVAKLYAKGSQALAPSPKEPGTHVEAMDAASVLATFDTLDSTAQIDMGVAA